MPKPYRIKKIVSGSLYIEITETEYLIYDGCDLRINARPDCKVVIEREPEPGTRIEFECALSYLEKRDDIIQACKYLLAQREQAEAEAENND